jgi:CxxC-x17-CxxC domain-containing protein
MDSLISRIFSGPAEQKVQAPAPVQPVNPQPVQAAPQNPGQQPAQPREAGPGRGRNGRVMHKAVCADCQKDCEIPFKPTGDRPVYCKECFSKRKSAPRNNNGTGAKPAAEVSAQPAPQPKRHVTVTKKGAGKLIISEILPPSTPAAKPEQQPKGPRDVPQRNRGQRPARRPRR